MGGAVEAQGALSDPRSCSNSFVVVIPKSSVGRLVGPLSLLSA